MGQDPSQHLSPVWSRYTNILVDRAEGAYIYGGEGRRYLDFTSGIGVTNTGHCHPRVVQAVQEQVATLIHVPNTWHIEAQGRWAELLSKHSFGGKAFFCNSGTEANEAAIKIARLYGHQKKIKNPAIIVMENSFHGRTLATLSATGNRKVQAGFEPLVSGFIRVPYDDLEAVRTIAGNNRAVVAVLVEPIQGEGGLALVTQHTGYLANIELYRVQAP